MSLKEKLFGWSPAKRTLRQLAQEGNIAMSLKNCDSCGESFLLPARAIAVNVPIDNSKLNLGGYCRECQKYLCPEHAEFAHFTMNSGEASWAAACKQCHVPLQPGPKT